MAVVGRRVTGTSAHADAWRSPGDGVAQRRVWAQLRAVVAQPFANVTRAQGCQRSAETMASHGDAADLHFGCQALQQLPYFLHKDTSIRCIDGCKQV